MKLPQFKSESEEADWWYDNREELGREFVAALKEGRNGIGSVGRAKLREAAKAEAEQKQTSATR